MTNNVIVGATLHEALFWKREWDLNAWPISATGDTRDLRGLIVDVIYVAPGADRLTPASFEEVMQELAIGQVVRSKTQIVYLEDPKGIEPAVEPPRSAVWG